MTTHSLSGFLEPLFTLAKYSGLLPFDDDFQLSRKWWKISVLLMVVIAVKAFSLRLYVFFVSIQSDNYLSIFIQNVIQFLSLAIIFSHFFSMYHFKNKLVNFGRTMAMLSEGYSYKLYVPTIYTPFGILINLLLFIMGFDEINDDFMFIVHISIFLFEILIYLMIMTFCAFLEIFHKHFKDIIKDIYNKSLELTTKKSLILISASEDVSEIYGLSLLFFCMRFLVFIVVMGHSISVDLNYFDNIPMDTSLKRLFNKLIFIFLTLYTLLMITGSCRRIQTSLNRFNVLVFREFRRRPDLVNNNVIKLYITKNPSVRFSACGFFSIENSLVTSILATAITYVVIFVQFYMPVPKL